MTYTRPQYKRGAFYEAKKTMIEQWELNEIYSSLLIHRFDIRRSAKGLGMSYGSFYLLIKKHGMKTRNGKVMK